MHEPGSVVRGRYRIERLLGEGGAARVVLATDLELDRPVALKLLYAEGALGEGARFADEARILAKLQHPNILPLYEAGVDEGVPFLAVEYLDGGTLLQKLRAGPMDSRTAHEYAAQVLEALDHAHRHGVLHRDVKPENVLLAKDGSAKLSDFGISKREGSGVRTRTGLVLGTPEFMAPEVLVGQPASPASDLYSWGCLAYLLVNGRPPHTGSTREIAVARHKGEIPQGKEIGPLARAMRRALEREPERRANADELRALLAGTRVIAPVTGLGILASLRTRVRAVAPALVVALGLGLGWLGLPKGSRSADPDGPPGAAPSGEPGSPTPDTPRRDLRPDEVLAWRERVFQADPEKTIERLHKDMQAQVDRNRGFRATMKEVRHGQYPDFDPTLLRQAAAALPHRQDLDADRELLRTVLTDASIPLRYRLELYQDLQQLGFLDAFFEAWNQPAPYRVGALLEVIARHHSLPVDPANRDLPEVDPVAPLGPGRHLLFRWQAPEDIRFPWLVPVSGSVSSAEMFGIMMARRESDNAWQIERHASAKGTFLLGPDLPGSFAVEFDLANLFVPDCVVVTVNRTPVYHHPSPKWAKRTNWDMKAFPEYRIRIELAPALLAPGANEVEVTVRPLPGLPRQTGIDFDRLVVELGPGRPRDP